LIGCGVGWLTLPGAEVCIDRKTGCSEGDTSLALDLWQLYRQSRRFAFGAGILLALIPTTDAPKQDPQGVQRDHARRYFTVEGMLRYYPYVGETVEWWVGGTGGLVVVSDRFVVKEDQEDDRALLGPRGVTVRTEGGTIGIAGGPVLSLAPHWSLGLTLRYGHWFLPEEPAHDPLGSQASLTGRNTVFSAGVTVEPRHPIFGSIRVRHFGPRPLDGAASLKSASTPLWNAEVGYRVSAKARVVVELFNVPNASGSDIDYFYTSRLPGEPRAGVEDVHTHPALPRSARVGLQLSF
jgi:hypothetical protein